MCHTLARPTPGPPSLPAREGTPSTSWVQPRSPSVHTETANTPPPLRAPHALATRASGTPSEHTGTDTVPPPHSLTCTSYLIHAECGCNSKPRRVLASSTSVQTKALSHRTHARTCHGTRNSNPTESTLTHAHTSSTEFCGMGAPWSPLTRMVTSRTAKLSPDSQKYDHVLEPGLTPNLRQMMGQHTIQGEAQHHLT